MPTELSHIITGLQKIAISVIDSGKTNAQRVAVALGVRFGGDSPPDFLGVQLALVQVVEDDLSRVLSLDASHVSEVVGNHLKLVERDESYRDVFGVLSDVRSSVEGVYGIAVRHDLFGGVTALPSDPVVLHRLGLRVHDRVLDDDFVLPAVKLPGWQPLDRQQLAAGLEPPLSRLGSVLADLSLDRKGADGTLLDKNLGVDELRRTLRFSAGCLASLYGLAGFDDLAAKIRPRRRSPRRPEDTGTDAAGGDPGDSGDGSPEPSSGDDPGAPAKTGPIGIVS